MMLSATFNNDSAISWRSVFLVEEIRVTGENHRPDAIHSQTLPHSVVSTHYIDIFELYHSHWAPYKTLEPLTLLQCRKNISYLRNRIQIFRVIVVNIQEYFPSVPWIACMCYIARRHAIQGAVRGKMFLYIDHSHIEYLLYYISTIK